MRPGMILYREELGLLLFMDELEVAEAMRLLARRFLFGEEPETENTHVDTFLQIAIPKQEADEQKYEKRIASASKGGSTTQANNKQYSSDAKVPLNKHELKLELEHQPELEHERGKTRARVFRPPTVEEVREYCQSRGNRISAERFVDHYSANGWKVGKNPMKDWKAAVRNWEKNDFSKDIDNTTSISGFDYDQLEALARKRGLEA